MRNITLAALSGTIILTACTDRDQNMARQAAVQITKNPALCVANKDNPDNRGGRLQHTRYGVFDFPLKKDRATTVLQGACTVTDYLPKAGMENEECPSLVQDGKRRASVWLESIAVVTDDSSPGDGPGNESSETETKEVKRSFNQFGDYGNDYRINYDLATPITPEMKPFRGEPKTIPITVLECE